MAINTARPIKHVIPGHLLERCWDRRQTVNLVSAGGLVEQSNAAKNNAVNKLAGSAAGRLAGWLAAAAGGCLASWLLADWLAGCWLAAAAAAGRLGA